MGVCTPGNDGAKFSFWAEDNFGDHAGLDEGELADSSRGIWPAIRMRNSPWSLATTPLSRITSPV